MIFVSENRREHFLIHFMDIMLVIKPDKDNRKNENYSSTSLMNIDMKILKLLAD